MTSKRNIESRLTALENDEQASSGRTFADVFPDDVANALRAVSLDLYRIMHQNADTMNDSEPNTTERFLALVRERYGIVENHDDEVRQALESLLADSWHRTPCDLFANTPPGFAVECDPETSNGETLTDLVRADREEEMAGLLVGSVYEAFADRGGRQVEVSA